MEHVITRDEINTRALLAREAQANNTKSLSVQFQRGDVVYVVQLNGNEIVCGGDLDTIIEVYNSL